MPERISYTVLKFGLFMLSSNFGRDGKSGIKL